MDLAKPGLIKNFCLPNALTTFQEYLVHYPGERTKREGERLIARMIADVPDENARRETIEFLEKIKAGARDLYL